MNIIWLTILVIWGAIGAINIFGNRDYKIRKDAYTALWIVALLSMLRNTIV